MDVVPSIQQTAALALGRLADHSDDLAEAVAREDIMPRLVNSLSQHNVSISSLGHKNASLVQTGFPVLGFPLYKLVCVCVCEREREETDRDPAGPQGQPPSM